jgi:asparagine synthase (glutamine-hydrolysing)
MCGISGIASKKDLEIHKRWLSKSREMLCHRGPDGEGEWWSMNDRIGLAHRRLAVVELSNLGHQPMSRGDAGLQIVFNGEIYNFREIRSQLANAGYSFFSESDTEVLLAAYQEWGYECLERLNGMFAFAMYDPARKTIFLARDRAGEKPLFYYKDDSTLLFASDLGVLLRNPALRREINAEALNYFLAFGYSMGDSTLVSGFRKLPAAHAMTFQTESGETNIWRYWALPALEIASNFDQSALLDEFENLLEASVTRQMEADVPVGVLLSGGLDSSLVTAMASRRTPRLKTYTVAMDGDSSLDEAKFAKEIASHFGTDHTVMSAESINAPLIESIAKNMGEPIADSSILPTFLVSREIRKSCTVALGGDGGDELFGGYGHYSQILDWIKKRKLMPEFLPRSASNLALSLLPVGFPGRNLISNFNFDTRLGVFSSATHFDARARRQLLGGTGVEFCDSESLRQSQVPLGGDPVQRFTSMDFQNYLSEDILVKVDRASMMSSLEVRAPFLDRHLVEFAFGRVPSSMKATSTGKKILPKLLARKLFPAGFDVHRKQGFSIPLASWLQSGEIKNLFWDTLTSSECFLNRDAIASILRNQELGYRNSERIFALFQFEVWRKEFNISSVSAGKNS